MGDISDMMLSGILCQECGGLMQDMSPSLDDLAKAPRDKQGRPIFEREAPGYPRTCWDCKPRRKRKHKSRSRR